MSETAMRRHLTVQYCQGNGVDVGSGGDPVVPWAIQVDLPQAQFDAYGHAHPVTLPVQWRTTEIALPFKDGVLDFVYSSHLLEDFTDWHQLTDEWDRVLKPGGYMIIMVPDKIRFNEAIARGGGGNANHKHEAFPGELTLHFDGRGYTTIRDGFTEEDPHAYNILYVGRKPL